MKDSMIVITPMNVKEKILKDLSKNKKLLNLKFFTFSELKKKLFFDYDKEALAYVIEKYHVHLSVAKIYLQQLYFLKDLKEEKVLFLNQLKKELDERNLLIYSSFKEIIKRKKVIVYGYHTLTKEQKKILEGISYELIEEESKNYQPRIFEASSMEEEVEFVLQEISKLIHQGISLSNILLIANEEYDSALKKYCSFFHIPFGGMKKKSFYNTLLAKEFLESYDFMEIDQKVLQLSEKHEDIDELIQILNLSASIEDKKIRKEFIVDDLKKYKVKERKINPSLKVVSLESVIDEEDYVFLLGFNVNSYPKIYRDDDFLSDEIKMKLDLDTSSDLFMKEKENILYYIRNIKHLVITYKLSGSNGKYYPSSLIEDLDISVFPCEIDTYISYSKLNSSLFYAHLMDQYQKYHAMDDRLGIYKYNLDIPYKEYNHQFKGISRELLNHYFQNKLHLSYTSLEKYHECAFKYYLSYILSLDVFEETFKTKIGLITHHILEIGLQKEIDISKEIMKFSKEKNWFFDSKEIFYLEKLSQELNLILVTLRKQMEKGKFNQLLFEHELYVYKDQGDFQVTFKGLIDKIMIASNGQFESLAVVDYKTGEALINLEHIQYGLHMQLPIYLYLLKKSNRFSHAHVIGFYLQKLFGGIPQVKIDKTYLEQREEELKLNGYSTNQASLLKIMDEDFENSSIIKGLKVKKDGEFDKRSKILSEEEMNELTLLVDKKIDETIDLIRKGDFKINPKVLEQKNVSCIYCPFKDICFSVKDDEVVLGGEV